MPALQGKNRRLHGQEDIKMKGFLGKNRIYIILFLFLLAKIFTIPLYKVIWWDSSVYVGMGKYIYSRGESGLWEETRPIAWPLMLGFLWKAGLGLFFGRLLEIIFGGMCILLTYKIGKRIFNERVSLLASLFLAFSPTFFFFNGIMLTEIVSTFFALLGVYYFIEKKYFASGISLGMAFMARFLQLLVFVVVILIILTYFDKRKSREYLKMLFGFLVPVIPYLVLNQFLYQNPLHPFVQQMILSRNSGWTNYNPISHYFIELFKENIFYLLSVFGVFLTIKRNANKKIIAAIFMAFFVFFNSIKQKETRFLIVLFPYMYLLISYAMTYIYDKIKNKTIKKISIAFVFIPLVISATTALAMYKNEAQKINQYADLQERLENAEGKVWITSPAIAAYSDKKIDKLVYYPYFDENKKEDLTRNLGRGTAIFFDSCDLACRPADVECEKWKQEIIQFFRQQLRTTYSSSYSQCRQFVFEK